MALESDRPRSQREIAQGLGQIIEAVEEPVDETPEPEPDEALEDDDEQADAEFEDEDEVEVEDDDELDPDEATEDGAFSLDLVVNGEEYTVTDRAEAIKLAQLGKHFTKLREEQVQAEKAIQEQQAQLQEERQRYAQALPVLETFLSAPLGEPPDPKSFQDQAQYLFAKDQYNEQLQNLQAVRAEMQRVQQEQAREQQAAFERLKAENAEKLRQKLPEWRDPKVQAKEADAIREYAQAMGVTTDELNNLVDHRFVLILRDAMRYRQAKQAGTEKVSNAKPKTKDAAPGSGPRGQAPVRKLKKAKEAIRKRGGKVQDVAPLMGQLLTAQPK